MYDGYGKNTNGQSTKIIIPSELQNVASIGTVIGEMLKSDKK